MYKVALKYSIRWLGPLILMYMVLVASCYGQHTYQVHYVLQGKDSSQKLEPLGIESKFNGREAARVYLNALQSSLVKKGYPAASVDSVFYDSTSARVDLYLGQKYRWVQIQTDSVDQGLLDAVGWSEREFRNKPMDFAKLESRQQAILTYYENNGYPFAEVYLKDVSIEGDLIHARLAIQKGPLYRIDSIRVFGKARVSKLFLQHYLGIPNGSLYDHRKLETIKARVDQLPYVKQVKSWDVSMLGTGSILNLYLQPKKSSEFNVLVGLLPSNSLTGKAQLTGDVHLNLRNSFGHGESILLNWQQLQPQSPRLNLGFNQPYFLRSKYGLDFTFDLQKRDSSYLQLNSLIGIQFTISDQQYGKIFYQSNRSFLLAGGIDTNRIITYKVLPPNIDVSSGNFGIDYHFVNTNYRLNPRKGNELEVTATAGLRKVIPNSNITNLKDTTDPGFNFSSLYDTIKRSTYRLGFVLAGAHYFPMGKNATLKTALHVGVYQSPQIFRNELFLIGGYQLLRGFDEESIYATRYAVFTAEYHYLIGVNSYIFGFSDWGFTRTKYTEADYSNSYISGGLGLEFETKFGLLNLSYAMGKRNDLNFDIRTASKIHFGYVTYF